jgi:Uma2 family endonuclease
MIVPLKSRFIQMSEEEFFIFCQEMEAFHVERDANGTILIMEPSGAESGNFDLEVGSEVRDWSKQNKRGKTFGSSAGFTLPNDAVRSPDVAWIEMNRWKALPKAEREKFPHIAPDFVVEIRSKTYSLSRLKEKMIEYRDNGVRLGWLIDPISEVVWIYRSDETVDKVDSFEHKLLGEDVLQGFELRLADIWENED